MSHAQVIASLQSITNGRHVMLFQMEISVDFEFSIGYFRAMKNQIKQEANTIFRKVVELRRSIHQYPELAFEEHRTAELVARTLKSLGIEVESGVAKTGVVGLLRGKLQGKCVALRADMDALPIEEQNNVSFKSKIPGKMHACGHDVHTATLLGAAMILSRIRDELNGTVKFIFQPSEEKNPGGAGFMIKEGVLENPKVETIFGLHVFAQADVGKVGFCPGPMGASADELYITIKGKGGHGAYPHLAVDPVIVAAEVVLALQKVVSRNIDPLQPCVLTIGKIQGGTTTNVIPDEVKLFGTLRAMNEEWRRKSWTLIEQTIKGITSAAGAKYELEIDKGYPVLVNNPDVTAFAKTASAEFLGKRNVFHAEPAMGAEDFSYYLQKVPGTFFRLGVRNKKKGIVHNPHTAHFNVDEEAMKVGSGVLAYLAYEYLK